MNQIVKLLSSSQVKEITFIGCIPFIRLNILLTKFTLVEKLILVEVEEANCECKHDFVYFDNSKHETKTTLSNLIYVEFHNVTTCLSILNYFIHNVAMFRLNTMKLYNSIGPDSSVQVIKKLLKLVRYSLETLHFSGVEWESSPLCDLHYVFPKLHELRYDLIYRNGKVLNLFCNISLTMPNLKRLNSLGGYLPFEENAVILGLKNIEYLQYGISAPARSKEFDVSVYAVSLPYLKFLELDLLCDNSSNCEIVGENKIQQSFNLIIHS